MEKKIPKKVKIVATIGPATNSTEGMKALAEAGVDVFRINMSHVQREDAIELVKRARAVEKMIGRPIAVMGDLMGPKIRIGNVEPGVELKTGGKIRIISKQVYGNEKQISLNFPTILRSLEKGTIIYIGDGSIKLEVVERIHDGVVAEVLVGGLLMPRRGFSAHGLTLKKFALTVKDKDDIKTMLEAGADALAISFVQTARDVKSVKDLLPQIGGPILIAKIETMAGVENAEKILEVADGLMVARGDLGLSVPMAEVPHIQKRLISLCLNKAKPVITATQMLDSMINRPLPTRAEVTDVANAILDGTDAVMLSEETALGKFPVETVQMMSQIIETAEEHVIPREFPGGALIADAVSASVVSVADQIKARLIIVLTQKGVTARRIARHRRPQPIIALSPDPMSIRKLNFTWGVTSMIMEVTKDFDDMIIQTRRAAGKNSVIKLDKDEPFVISAGIPFGRSGTTNLVLVERV